METKDPFHKYFFCLVSYFPYFLLAFTVLPLLFVCPDVAQVPFHIFWNTPFCTLFDTVAGFF